MSSPSHIEKEQVVAQAMPAVPRFERVAVILALSSFSAICATGLLLYLLHFQVDHHIVKVVLAVLAIGAVGSFFGVRPASQLTPRERMVRAKRGEFLLIGVLSGAALLGSIASAAELDTTRDWFMLAFIASSPISVHLLVNTRFGMG